MKQRKSPYGKFLYASNRRHDNIAVYSIDAAGKLALVTTVPSNGKAPRNFAIDPKDGKVERTGDPLDVAFPVCVTFLKGPTWGMLAIHRSPVNNVAQCHAIG